ncbi:DUF6443 domain-containing protein [Aquimarina sp. SS2-1]|uniref:DUF6443 domain-containing protein n=1 Tax=Aquimarina besae TaxID=3342247 RepID=UPI00366C3E90
MRNIFLVIAVLVCTALSAQTTTENYVKTTSYQTEVKEGEQSQVLESDKIVSVNYVDGLGRAKQSVAVRAGGQRQDTNILDWTDDWTAGGGHTPLFNMNGQSVDNQRIYGTNPFGEQSLLWRCGNDTNNDADGGWNTDYIPVDKNVAYRYTVWVKRTGSQNGNTYHGTRNVNNLSGTANNNPYFLVGDMPNLNQWYLLVGVIHPHTYTGGNSGISGVYDINGTKVKNGNDFKWRNNTTTSQFRSYLYYATDVNVKQYFWNPVLTKVDGNGAPINQLIQQSKPKDIITHYEYDDYGRQTREYLPYASDQTQNGAIYTDPLAELNSFYNTPKYQNTTNPYSETVVEPSPLNRPLKQAAPGLDWKAKTLGDDHTIKLDRRTNVAADDVVYFKVDFYAGNTVIPMLQKVGDYPENELFVNITKDENWVAADGKNHTTEEYTDKLGRVVLKRTFNSPEPSGGDGGAHDTYYVYDDFGNLTYVLPPKVNVIDGVSTTELNELGYQYKYDSRNRLVEKKIPGKGWEYIIYNKLDQPILTQDPVQRPKREWLFTKYDVFGRVVYTGLYKYPIVTTRAGLQQAIDAAATVAQFETKKTSYTTIAGTGMYYSNDAYPQNGIVQIYTINYYDNYTFDRDGMNKPTTVYGVNTTNSTKGLATGSKVRVLGTNQWITTVTAYDIKGQVIWTGTRNDYLDTTDKAEMQLDFTGKPLKVKTNHTKGSNAAIVTTDTFTYDHMGRLLTQKQQINNQAEELIAHNVYDELGQLESKKVGNAEQAPLQTVDYKYNIRGWLTDINDVNNIGDDLFTFKINYDTPTHAAKALYNGNISETEWKTANDNTKRWYRYDYDPLNRIKSAIDNTTDNRYSLSNINYDKNGNIMNLKRNGHVTINGWGTFYGVMDDLDYRYDAGNKLLKVIDNGSDGYGFKDGTNTNNDFVYDANGNMTVDNNKDITSITYNHLNLPEQISIKTVTPGGKFGEIVSYNTINYVYDATGAKLRKRVVNNALTNITEYTGNYIYNASYSNNLPPGPYNSDETKLTFFNHPEGYTEPESDGTFMYIYQHKDHLGNIRLSYSDKDNDGKIDVLRNNADVDGDGDFAQEILEEKNYYPFGLQHKGYNNTITGRKHNYGFVGKEENNELGLGWLDFGARNYDASLGRWMNLDPLAEQMRRHSPYNYAFDNPIYFMDPDGMAPSDRWQKGTDGTLTWVNSDGGDTTDYVDTVDENGNITSTEEIVVETTEQECSSCEVDINFKRPGSRFSMKAGGDPRIQEADLGDATGEVADAIMQEAGVSPIVAVVILAVLNPKKAAKKMSDYKRLARKNKGRAKSVQNVETDVTKSEFGSNLEANGYKKSVSKDGKATNYNNGSNNYSVRDNSKTTGKPSADYSKNGGKTTLKIRLENDPE